jgi:RNA polymerase sigma-70 factor (ECF subfamily)
MDDRAATFTRWAEEHRPMLVRLARAYAATDADVEDLVQEMLLAVWRALPSFRGEALPSTWIYRVALSVALGRRRTEGRRVRTEGTEVEEDLERAAGRERAAAGAGEAAQMERLRLAAVLAAMRQMSPVDRSVLVLALEGASLQEIAEVIGITANNAGVRLHRARRRLAARMEG